MTDNWMWLLLTPSWMYSHMNIILDKRSRGQPVSFTDFFGYLVGETILKDVSYKGLHGVGYNSTEIGRCF